MSTIVLRWLLLDMHCRYRVFA